jgi:hypothetical protein
MSMRRNSVAATPTIALPSLRPVVSYADRTKVSLRFAPVPKGGAIGAPYTFTIGDLTKAAGAVVKSVMTMFTLYGKYNTKLPAEIEDLSGYGKTTPEDRFQALSSLQHRQVEEFYKILLEAYNTHPESVAEIFAMMRNSGKTKVAEFVNNSTEYFMELALIADFWLKIKETALRSKL